MKRNIWIPAAVACITLASPGFLAGEVHAKAVSPVKIEAKEYDLTLNTSPSAVFPRGVSYEGISLEGLTVEEARNQISDYVQERYDRYIRIIFVGNNYEYRGSNLGTTWLNPEVVNQLDGAAMSGNFIEQYKKQKDLDENPLNLDLEFSLDTDMVRGFMDEYIEAYTTDPRNATVHREGGQFIVTESVDGRQYDKEAVCNELIGKLTDFSTAEEIYYDVPCTVTKAQYDSSFFQFSGTPLGSYSTNDLGSDERRNNIILSSGNMNGHVFYPGEQISTLNMFGDITAENGYQLAGAYEEGKQIQSIGGGICQTTTTLYNAVIRAELTVNKRRGHTMIVSYVPPAMDATVYYQDRLDFVFTNSTPYPIYIESWVDGDTVSVNIWGVETRDPGRRIEFYSDVLSIEWPDPLFNEQVDDVNNIVGPAEIQDKHWVEVTPHPQLRAISYKIVYQNDAEISREVLNDNTYNKMPGLVFRASDCRIQANPVPNDESPNATYRFFDWGINVRVCTPQGWDWPSPASVQHSIEMASIEAESRSREEASRQAESEWIAQSQQAEWEAQQQQAEWQAQQPAPENPNP